MSEQTHQPSPVGFGWQVGQGLQWKARSLRWDVRGCEDLERKARWRASRQAAKDTLERAMSRLAPLQVDASELDALARYAVDRVT